MELLRVLLLWILYVDQAVALAVGDIESLRVSWRDFCLEKSYRLLVVFMRLRVATVTLAATSDERRDQQESEYCLESHYREF